MRTSAYKYSSLIIGLLAAVAIVLSQSQVKVFSKSPKAASEQTAPEKTASEETDLPVLSISATSFPASAQVGLFQQATCLFELIFSIEKTEPSTAFFECSINNFYRTILSVIISPNAP
jgi:hypothetical protein